MLSSVNGFRTLAVATLLFTNHIRTLASVWPADARFADSHQETHIQRSPSRTAVSTEANQALYVSKWSSKEEGVLSGVGERRLHAEEEEEVQLSETVGEEVRARLPQSGRAIQHAVRARTEDAGESTTSVRSIERNVDTGRRRRIRVASERTSVEREHGRVQKPGVLLNVKVRYGRDASTRRTRWHTRRNVYSKYWKALWIAGIALGSGLVASSFGSGLNFEYISRVEDAAGMYPGGESRKDYEMYKALVRLTAGIYTLAITGISYLIIRNRRKKQRRSERNMEYKFS